MQPRPDTKCWHFGGVVLFTGTNIEQMHSNRYGAGRFTSYHIYSRLDVSPAENACYWASISKPLHIEIAVEAVTTLSSQSNSTATTTVAYAVRRLSSLAGYYVARSYTCDVSAVLRRLLMTSTPAMTR